MVERFRFPAATHKTLYRGVNSLDEYQVAEGRDKQHKIVRINSIVPFTDRRSIASEFGAYILEVEVPMVKLIFFNELLPQHALRGEAEYLVIGGWLGLPAGQITDDTQMSLTLGQAVTKRIREQTAALIGLADSYPVQDGSTVG